MKGYVRKPELIRSALQSLPDNSLVAKRDLVIQIPYRFQHVGLASFGGEDYIVGAAALLADSGEYGVLLVNAYLPTTLNTLRKLTIEGVDYLELSYPAGSRIITNKSLVHDEDIPSKLYHEFIELANVPWYLSLDDMCCLFDSAREYAGSNVGRNRIALELIIAQMTRVKGNEREFYRHVIKSKDDLENKPPVYVSPMNVSLSASDTFSKLAGNRFEDGVTGALLNPTSKINNIDKLMRS